MLADRLPEVPWDRLRPARRLAAAHPGGLVDLSMGAPVDATPEIAQEALAAAANAPGYPPVAGTPEVHEAVVAWARRRLGVAGLAPSAVLPTIGLKEFVAWLPTLLGLGSNDTVMIPELAYPTYEIGAVVAGADVLRSDATIGVGPQGVSLIWINSPSNPTGRVLGTEHLRKMVEFARQRKAVLVSDECYFELPWSPEPEHRPVSLLHPAVCGGDHRGLLALHSLSKRSNAAGYRFGVALGDPRLVSGLVSARRHLGQSVPTPVQHAAAALFDDDDHVAEQVARYGERREILLRALDNAGFVVDDSHAGLFLWVTRDQPCWDTIDWLARRGILATPGDFYGPSGSRHVRVSLTASDEHVAAAAARLH